MWLHALITFSLGSTFKTGNECRAEPELGEEMRMTPSGVQDSVTVGQWIHVTEDGSVDDVLVLSDGGWMQMSEQLTQQFSTAAHYSPARTARRAPSCWFKSTATVSSK
jgi:hypothetical protein